jgi:hypothetical protein
LDATIVFTLPDSGGVLANGMPMDTSAVEAELRDLFSARPAELRAVLLMDNPARPAVLVLALKRAAEAAGGHLYDAESSGWVGFTPVPSPLDSSRHPKTRPLSPKAR